MSGLRDTDRAAGTALTSQSFEEMCEPLCDGSQAASPRTGPRFYVTSLTGFGSAGGNDSHEATVYQVLDSAYNCELVIETLSRAAAERLAAQMSAGDLRAAGRQKRHRARQLVINARYRAARK